MKKLLSVLSFLIISPVLAQEEFVDTTSSVSTTNIQEEKSFNMRESHWLTTFGFEYSSYQVIADPKYNFQGKKSFTDKNDQSYLGLRLGYGGEIYLGAGFITRTMLDGYFYGTFFDQALNGGKEADNEEFAFTKKSGHIFGADITQSLGWMFDLKTKNPFMDEWSYLTVEPFVEAGLGMARAYNRINYRYDTTPAPTGAYERYRYTMNDEIMNTRLAAGLNVAATTGFFLQLKASMNTYMVSERKIKGMSHTSGSFSDSDKNVKLDPIMVYTLGGGYKF